MTKQKPERPVYVSPDGARSETPASQSERVRLSAAGWRQQTPEPKQSTKKSTRKRSAAKEPESTPEGDTQ